MTTSPLPITWWELGVGVTPMFERSGGLIYSISGNGSTVVELTGDPQVLVPFFEITQGDDWPKNIYEQVRALIQSLEVATMRECLRWAADNFSGNVYGLLRFHDTVRNDKGCYIDTMHLGLAFSTNPLKPNFVCDNPLSPFGDEDYEYHVMEDLECWNHGLLTWKEPANPRPSRFEREWVI